MYRSELVLVVFIIHCFSLVRNETQQHHHHRNHTTVCTNGPYLYDMMSSEQFSPEGIGCSVEHMKVLILLATVFNLTFIPNPRFFINQFHHTDFYDKLGWNKGIDCHSEQVMVHYSETKPINEYSLKIVNLTVFAKDLREQRVYTKEVQQLCQYVQEDKPFSFISKKLTASNANNGLWSTFYQNLHTPQHESDLSKTVFVLHRDYWRYAFEGYQCSLDYIRQKFELSGHFPVSHHSAHQNIVQDRSRINSSSGITINPIRPVSKTIAIDRHRRIFKLGIHFRYGDMWHGDVNDSRMSVTLKEVITMLDNLFSSQSVLEKEFTEIYFFSEGTVSDFAALQQAYPKTIFHVENYKSSRRFLTRNLVLSSNTSSGVSSRGLESDSAEDDDELEQLQRIKIAKQHRNHDASDTAEHSFDLMVQSDIFIATESCFSSLIAGLNRKMLTLAPREANNPKRPKLSWKFQFLPNMVPQKRIIEGDLSEFNMFFCNMHYVYDDFNVPKLCGVHKPAFDNSGSLKLSHLLSDGYVYSVRYSLFEILFGGMILLVAVVCVWAALRLLINWYEQLRSSQNNIVTEIHDEI